MQPENMRRLDTISEIDHQDRAALRDLRAQRFARNRSSDLISSHTGAYQRVRGLMASEKLFDIEQEPQAMRAKYGPTQFGQQCLIARDTLSAVGHNKIAVYEFKAEPPQPAEAATATSE